MTIKRKIPPPPSQPHYSDDDSLDDEEQYDEETETDHSDSDPDLPTKSSVALPDLSGSEDLSGFDESLFEEEGEEQVEKLKLGVKAPQIEPDMKRLKLSEPEQSPFKKSASAFARIYWSKQDEMVVLDALSEYQSVNGELPPPKDQASFLASFSGFLSFRPTLQQLANKIYMLRRGFVHNIKKWPNVKITNPHKRTVFEMCTKLFQDGTNGSQKGIQLEVNNDDSGNAALAGDGKANGAMRNWSPTNSGSGNGAADQMRSCIHLRSKIEDMISRQQCEKWISVEGVIARIGEARAQSLEAKTKKLNLDAIKLRARKKKLKAEVFGLLAKEMT